MAYTGESSKARGKKAALLGVTLGASRLAREIFAIRYSTLLRGGVTWKFSEDTLVEQSYF